MGEGCGRRKKAHVPNDIAFQTKPQIALDQIRAAHAAGIAPGVVLADAGYGGDGSFREGLSALGLAYVVGIQSTPSVWPPGQEPLPAKQWSGRGRKPTRLRRSADHHPISVKELALSLPKKTWRRVDLAGRHERAARLALCRSSRAPGRPRRKKSHAASRQLLLEIAAPHFLEGRRTASA